MTYQEAGSPSLNDANTIQPSGYTKKQENLVRSLSAIMWVVAIVWAIHKGKKFWPIVGYSILGSTVGGAIGLGIVSVKK